MSPSNPRKWLPVNPSQEHLRKQAKRVVKVNPSLQLADAQQQIARGYGCRNWVELMHVVETMNRGADHLSGPSNAEQEPLPKAANQNDTATVRALLSGGQFTQHDLDLALARSVLKFDERREIAQLLVEHGADPDGQYGANYGPIVFVTGESLDADGLAFLIQHGADITFKPVKTKYGEQCPMSYWLGSYVRGRNDQKHRGIEMLLNAGAHIPDEVNPAMLAIHRGDAKTLADLIDQDPPLISRRFANMPYGNIALAGGSLLHCAVEFNELECLSVLLQRHADINIASDVINGIGGQTPVFHVINTNWDSQFQTLEYLASASVGRSIDLSVKASFTWYGTAHTAVTPIEFSNEPGQSWGRKNAEAEQRLLALLNHDRVNLTEIPQKTGGGSDRQASVSSPSLFSAATAAQPDAVKMLIDGGADVNSRDEKSNTPLWLVCQSRADVQDRITVASLLIDAGAQIRYDCENRSTALHIAAQNGPVAMLELLLRHDAKEWQTDKDGKRPIDYAREGSAPDKEKIIELLDRPVITDPVFKSAFKAIQAGDLPGLESLLKDYPNLVHDRATEPACYPPGYFKDPKLLWFIANNPTLMDKMPANIVQIGQAIIAAGAEQQDLDYTLELVMTSSPAAAQGHQLPLMKLLLNHHADPGDLKVALAHCELQPVKFLLQLGYPMTAPIAASLGDIDELRRLLPKADSNTRQLAFGLAVINRQVHAARLCLEVGADVNAFLPVHAHSTAAHQVAVNNDVAMLQLLVEHHARLDARDKLWNGTPLGWAIHTRNPAAEQFLRGQGCTV